MNAPNTNPNAATPGTSPADADLPEVLLERPDAPSEPPAEEKVATGGRWWLQFSLRWLLVAMALVVAFCAWWFRPKEEEVELGGGALIERFQIREMQPDKDHTDLWQQRHGTWRLYDRERKLFVSGNNRNGQPSGIWTWYDDEGYVVQVVEVAEERVVSATTYHRSGAKELEVVDSPADAAKKSEEKAKRIARHSSAGQIEYEGALVDGVRHGDWKFYFESGEPQAEGVYRNGRREGWWQVRAKPGEAATRVYHGGGVEIADAEKVARELADSLKSSPPSEQAEAALALERLGELGVEPLLAALEAGSPPIQLVALRVAARQRELSATTRAKIEKLAAATEPSRVACRALTILAQGDPAKVTPSLERLSQWAAGDDAAVASEAAAGLIALHEHALPMLARELSLLDVARRRKAAKTLSLCSSSLFAKLRTGDSQQINSPKHLGLLEKFAEMAASVASDADPEVKAHAAEVQQSAQAMQNGGYF